MTTIRPGLFLFCVWIAGLAGAEEAPPDEARLRQAAQLRGLAQAEMEEGNCGLALEHLDELANLLPDNILPPINRAICLFRLNRQQEAMEAVARARVRDPDNPQMLYTLALILERQGDREDEWNQVVTHYAATHPRDPRPYYLRAERASSQGDWPTTVASLEQATRRDPENLVLLTELLVAAAQTGDPDTTSDALEGVEDRLNGFEGSLIEFADRLRDSIDRGGGEALRPPALILRNLLRPTDLYQLGLIPLTGGQQPVGQLFPQLDFDPPLPKSIQGGQDIIFAFRDITLNSGFGGEAGVTQLLLAPREQTEDLLFLNGSEIRRLALSGSTPAIQPLDLRPKPTGQLIYQDLDQDGISDLASADAVNGLRFYRGLSDDKLAAGVVVWQSPADAPLSGLHSLDIDHDGDLDLFLARLGATDTYLQNNGDGSWTEQTDALHLAGGESATTGVVSADFDDDGDLDLVTVHLDSPPRLYLNRRAGPLTESGRSWGLDSAPSPTRGVQLADFNNDGLFDLLFWNDHGGALYLNRGGRFESVSLDSGEGPRWQALISGDFDNDGDQDVLVADDGQRRIFLLRNLRSSMELQDLEIQASNVNALIRGDFDHDGDLDLGARLADGQLRLWSNEGGNRNQWVSLRLQGRIDNNSKNNSQGLFTRIEVRTGDAFQATMGNGGINHLGLGAARLADVIRVVWTNGLAQTWLRTAANQTLVEEQVLKGSCPFLYTWNGERFQFVTDLMWRSPLGMLLPDGTQAPHRSARDYVLISGEQLRPAGDHLWLQVTEELWETIYADRIELMAVDHPETSQLVIDEAFRPPPYPREAPAHWVDRQLLPTQAFDQEGRDVLPLVSARDGDHVAPLPLSRYQGITLGHFLELTFEDVPTDERLRLVLSGWIFPTDTTINFALSQGSGLRSEPPRLEVLDPDGAWRTLEPFMGFPNGKRKAVVVELTDRVPAGTLRLRIPTTLQIYWDSAVLAVGESPEEARWTRLDAVAADLHYRGFSEMDRASKSSPHLFTYQNVDSRPRFRDLEGRYTRFGPVEELLRASDNRYVVMNAGDEMTLRFDARSLPELPSGWRRDWVLFSDGWVKDGDIHTRNSQTVEPLPYHGMTAYPDQPAHRVPSSPAYTDYLDRYQIRGVTDEPFRDWLRPPVSALDDSDP